MTGGIRHDGGVVEVSKGQEHGLSFHSSVLPSPKTKIAISPPTNSIYRGPGAPKSGTPCTAIWGSVTHAGDPRAGHGLRVN